MLGLFDMVAFYIRDHPQVPGVLAKWVAGILPSFRTFEIFLPGVFLGYSHRVEVKDIII
jgi:hypothetical protein